MRTKEEVARVQRLIAEGQNDCEIARRTGISRETVRAWRHGRTPRKRALELQMRSCTRCGHGAHLYDRLPLPEYTYLLGLYLGDGFISSGKKGVLRLRVYLDTKYPGIIDECVRSIGAVLPASKVDVRRTRPGVNCAQVSSYSKSWPCLLPQHGPGMKHTRRIVLKRWQQSLIDRDPRPLLRGLIHSDGCRVINRSMGRQYLRYMFTNASGDIRRMFCDACDQLEIPWRQSNTRSISIARREGVEILDSFIGPKS
jgi:hypothetical protein